MRRLTDWAFYLGLAALAGAVIVSLAAGMGGQAWAARLQPRLWWPLVIVGIVLVVISALPWLGNARRAVGPRTLSYGLNAVVSIVLVFGVIGFVEALSARHSQRVDLTENRRHSLSPQTIQVLKNLKSEVNAVGFFRSDQPGKRVAEDLFKQYASYAGKNFTWKVVDPDRDPALARRYGIESYGTIVLETKARSEKVLDAEEEKLTNGLVKVTREGKRTIYVLQGHGEHEITNTDRPGFSEAKAALERSNYDVKPLVLAREGKLPDDAAVVIVPGPRTELFAPEVDALDAYLGKGGKILMMIDPPFPQRVQDATVKKMLARWGVELGDNLIVELSPIGRLFGIGPEVPIIQQYEPHPITRDMGGITTLFPLTRSVTPVKTLPTGVNVQPLAKTSPESWGETDRQALEQGTAKPDPQDPKGPLPVATVVTKDKARLVVYGTSNLATNQFLNVQGNRDFFLNTVSWLAEEEDQITVRAKDTKSSPIFLSAQQARLVFLLPVVVLPGLVLAGGIAAVLRRRSAK
jgi:gliding motility-associatede transport system auxiliary component